MKYRPEMTQELLKKYVTYDPDTGVLTRTHVLDRGHNRKLKNFTPRSVTPQGYRQLGMFKTSYLVHRLIWLYMTGEWPDQIDHINGVRLDNRWSNLRNVTDGQNKRNMGLNVNNKSGTSGVFWYPRYQKWEVTICRDKQHYYLGRYADKDEAIRVRKTAEVEHDYHPNHGNRESHR